MYEVSTVSLEGIWEEVPGGAKAEVWGKSVEAFLNGRWEKGWEIVHMFCVGGSGQDAVLQKLVVVWKLRGRRVTA